MKIKVDYRTSWKENFSSQNIFFSRIYRSCWVNYPPYYSLPPCLFFWPEGRGQKLKSWQRNLGLEKVKTKFEQLKARLFLLLAVHGFPFCMNRLKIKIYSWKCLGDNFLYKFVKDIFLPGANGNFWKHWWVRSAIFHVDWKNSIGIELKSKNKVQMEINSTSSLCANSTEIKQCPVCPRCHVRVVGSFAILCTLDLVTANKSSFVCSEWSKENFIGTFSPRRFARKYIFFAKTGK